MKTEKYGLGKQHPKLFQIWRGIRFRCSYKKYKTFHRYGGRGIGISAEWADFARFVEWADGQDYRPGLSIERIDNDADYGPGNCRFASKTEQARNRWTNKMVSYNGETKCLSAWCESLALDMRTIWSRLDRGWTVEAAFSPIPPRSNPVCLTVGGRTQKAEEWAAEIGVSLSTIYTRLRKGLPIDAPRGPTGPKISTVYRRKPGPVARQRVC
jgi:hypothetical protein